MDSRETQTSFSVDGSHRCSCRSRTGRLPEISVSVRKPALAPEHDHEHQLSPIGHSVITILRFISSIESDTFNGEGRDVFSIEGHGMIMANPNIFLRVIHSPASIAFDVGLLHHLEEIGRLVSLQGGSKKDSSKDIAIL